MSAGLGLRVYGLVCTPAPGIAMQASGALASLPTDSVDPCLEGHAPAIASGPGREREGNASCCRQSGRAVPVRGGSSSAVDGAAIYDMIYVCMYVCMYV